MFNIVLRGREIKALVRDCDRELKEETREDGKIIIASYNKEAQCQLYVYIFLTYATILGWSLSAEKGQLPMRAWYPFDTTKSPAYQLTYIHQCLAVAIGAGVDVGTDTLVTSLVSQCRCRLRLLDLSLRTLCDGFQVGETGLIAPEEEEVIYLRLRRCVQRHQAVLNDAQLLQDCFSIATLSQFTVSIFIICVTAYQLAFESKTIIGVASMIFYLVTMMMQVFIYCYQGNQLVVESEAISAAAYECPWYTCRAPLRLALLVIMTRATRSFKLTAANLTELSLATFVSIIKASYTFFTVLQGVVDVS
ncbi:unnamed protein product [Colias eurytheme]|nr:unnamed protein product [Colias eurytheme]